jgi:hypothetical protein
MKKILLCIFSFIILLISCSKDDKPIDNLSKEQTVIMFFPWSTNLLPYFMQNISDFETTLQETKMKDERVLVCLATSPHNASLYEIKYNNGQCIADTLKHYSDINFTTEII